LEGLNATVITTEKLPLGRWHHVALVRAATYIAIYVNGKQVASAKVQDVFDHNNPHFFRVGSRWPPSGASTANVFDSQIDGMLWFEQAFTPAEIQKLYTSNFARVLKTKELFFDLKPWLAFHGLEALESALQACGAKSALDMEYLTDKKDLDEISGIPTDPAILDRLWLAILGIKEQCEEERRKHITEYDVFLSHRQISGGDMAQAIKLQLLDINPKLKVFLDVDDLNIIHNLENNIIHTKNIILLVTEGAVSRPFVQLEVVTAVKHHKNIIVMHDERGCKYPKGEELLPLPTEMQQALEQTPIPYFRESRFRDVAMLKAYSMLKL